MNFRHLFCCGTEEYACDKQHNIVSFTAHSPPDYQERIPIGVHSSNVMKYMEIRITQSIDSPLYHKRTNLIRPI